MSNKALLSNVYFEGIRRYLRFVDVFFFLSFEKLYNNSYFKKTFPPRGSAKSTSTLCARSAASVEAGRRPRKRSLLFVNEHFEGKPDAKRALLGSFSYIPNKKRPTRR